MKRLPIILAFAVVTLAGVVGWFALGRSPYREAMKARELATWGLANHLARTFPGKRALVLSNPFVALQPTEPAVREAEAAGLRGLRRGFGEAVRIEAVVAPELQAGALTNPRAFFIDPETTTPLSYLVAPDAPDQALKTHPGCDLVVSLIGLPVDLGRVAAWRSSGPPSFALLLPDLRLIGDVAALRGALARGKLAAFVLARPGIPERPGALSGDLAEEFNRRFLLVTSNSLDSIARTYPGLFRGR